MMSFRIASQASPVFRQIVPLPLGRYKHRHQYKRTQHKHFEHNLSKTMCIGPLFPQLSTPSLSRPRGPATANRRRALMPPSSAPAAANLRTPINRDHFEPTDRSFLIGMKNSRRAAHSRCAKMEETPFVSDIVPIFACPNATHQTGTRNQTTIEERKRIREIA